jgi:hypothetical protein
METNNNSHPHGSSGTATSIPASCLFNPSARPDPIHPIFEGFLAADELAVWIGREKDRKSTVVLNCAVCAALGRDFLGFRFVSSRPQRVVMFDYESKDGSIHRRYSAICDAMNLTSENRTTLANNLHIVELRKLIHDGTVVPYINTPEGVAFWQSAVHDHPADLYVVDPLRCFHGLDENNSGAMAEMLARIRRVFRSGVIVPQHMVKRPQSKKDNIRLKDDMRLWSDGCRGSGAIKAQADVILCQEFLGHSLSDSGEDTVWFGVIMKDAADIDPMALEESAEESFLWQPLRELPAELRNAMQQLRASGSWRNKSEAAGVLIGAGWKRATAFLHVKNLIHRGALQTRADGGVEVATLGAGLAAVPPEPVVVPEEVPVA